MDGTNVEIAETNGFLWCRGLTFPLDQDVLTPRIRKSLRNGGYETKEAEAVLKCVKPEDRVMELGGGIGFMSTLVAVKGRAQAVHTYEANPHLIPYIQRVHAANSCTDVEINHAVLGEQSGQAEFYIRQNILASSLTADDDKPFVDVAQVDVRSAKAEFNRISPTVLICDIEGAEAHLIPALPLGGLRAAIVELHPQWIGAAGVNKVFQAFIDAGLAYFPRFSTNKVVCFRRAWHVT